MLCAKCNANLPEGSQFCLKCGAPVRAPATSTALTRVISSSACGKCGTNLPSDAEFCLKCGQPVISTAIRTVPATPPPALEAVTPLFPPPRRKRRIAIWLLLLVLIGVIAWAATSQSPGAQQFQEFVGWSHTQTIIDAPVSVNPHSLVYYKFTVPAGALNVSLSGQFSAAAGISRNKDKVTERDKDKENDNNVETYVLTEAAFAIWQNGYATSSLYESGRVTQGTVSAELPSGAGIYYLVLSNKFSRGAKAVQTTVFLHYKSWLPEQLRLMRDRFWNWIGL